MDEKLEDAKLEISSTVVGAIYTFMRWFGSRSRLV